MVDLSSKQVPLIILRQADVEIELYKHIVHIPVKSHWHSNFPSRCSPWTARGFEKNVRQDLFKQFKPYIQKFKKATLW